MKVVIIYNEPVKGFQDSEDVVSQVSLVAGALSEIGYDYISYGIDYCPQIISMLDDVPYLIGRLGRFRGTVVFNLVESLGKDQRLSSVVAGLFELVGLPYTGAPFQTLMVTTDKALTKTILKAEGIRTPEWWLFRDGISPSRVTGFPVLLKPAFEDASIGIDEDSLLYNEEEIVACLKRMISTYNQPILIERFIEGREFNVSLVERPDGTMEVLPVAEMVFNDWPEGKPRIVSYRAKWSMDSFEAKNTVRRFNPEDAPLDKIKEVSLRCWDVLGLKGYARVDMRMDAEGNLYVLEVNANPCLSPDAGFIAASEEAGYSAREVVDMIIRSALRKGHPLCRQR